MKIIIDAPSIVSYEYHSHNYYTLTLDEPSDLPLGEIAYSRVSGTSASDSGFVRVLWNFPGTLPPRLLVLAHHGWLPTQGHFLALV
jgi:hypothetical protein